MSLFLILACGPAGVVLTDDTAATSLVGLEPTTSVVTSTETSSTTEEIPAAKGWSQAELIGTWSRSEQGVVVGTLAFEEDGLCTLTMDEGAWGCSYSIDGTTLSYLDGYCVEPGFYRATRHEENLRLEDMGDACEERPERLVGEWAPVE